MDYREPRAIWKERKGKEEKLENERRISRVSGEKRVKEKGKDGEELAGSWCVPLSAHIPALGSQHQPCAGPMEPG